MKQYTERKSGKSGYSIESLMAEGPWEVKRSGDETILTMPYNGTPDDMNLVRLEDSLQKFLLNGRQDADIFFASIAAAKKGNGETRPLNIPDTFAISLINLFNEVIYDDVEVAISHPHGPWGRLIKIILHNAEVLQPEVYEEHHSLKEGYGYPVTAKFADPEDAKDFKDELKQKFNYPPTKHKYQVVHGTTDTGNTVFVENSIKSVRKDEE